MRTYTLQPLVTVERAVWLLRLLEGPRLRPTGRRVGNHCMNLGWTEWLEDPRMWGEYPEFKYLEKLTARGLAIATALRREGYTVSRLERGEKFVRAAAKDLIENFSKPTEVQANG